MWGFDQTKGKIPHPMGMYFVQNQVKSLGMHFVQNQVKSSTLPHPLPLVGGRGDSGAYN